MQKAGKVRLNVQRPKYNVRLIISLTDEDARANGLAQGEDIKIDLRMLETPRESIAGKPLSLASTLETLECSLDGLGLKF